MGKNRKRMLALILCIATLFASSHTSVYAGEIIETETAVSEEPEDATIMDMVPDMLKEAAVSGETVETEPVDADAVDIASEALPEGELISEEAIGAEPADMASEEVGGVACLTAAVSDAEQKFARLAESKDLMALIYLTDACEVKLSPDIDSITTAVLGSGYTVYIKGVHISEERIWYNVSFWMDEAQQSGYVEEQYLAYADEDWKAWRINDMLPALTELLFGENGSLSGCEIMAYDLTGNADIAEFPDAFQGKLQKIKDAHPDWIFVPVKTELDFDTAVSKEMGDKSWIQDTASNRSAGYVGDATKQSGWSFATQKAVSFYMNTENYLDDTHIFAFEQLTFNSSYHSEAAVQEFLNGTFMKGSLPDDDEMTYAHAFYTIGEDRKLSPTHLASRVYQEQGKGTSDMISGNYPGYEGYYNYFNIGATGSGNDAVIKNGLEYAKKQEWNSAYKSLSGGAATIGNNYILKGQDTSYLQKFNVAPGAVSPTYTHQYMQNIQAPWSEAASTKKMYSGAGSLNSAFVFKIPLYKNMPGEETEQEIPPEPEPDPVPGQEPEVSPEDILFPAEGFYVVPVSDRYYTGSAIKPQVTVYDAEAYDEDTGSRKQLVLNQDYTVSYKNNTKVNLPEDPSPLIIVKGKGNYGGVQEIPFDILPVSISRSDVRTDYQLKEKYTGKVVKASPLIMRGGVRLVKGKDYTLSYPENGGTAYQEPGTYKIEIIGKGGYTGTRTVYEVITRDDVAVKKSISTAIITGVESKTYTGIEKDVKQRFQVTLDGELLTESTDGGSGDFIAVYKNVGKAGTATLELHGIGDYKGTLKKTFKIAKADLQTLAMQGKVSVNYKSRNPYVKGRVTPAVTVTYTRPDGKTKKLVKGTDYTVSYKNNTRVTSSAGMSAEPPAITVKGKGNYKGTVIREFTITDGEFENTAKVSVSARDVVYKNEAGFYRTSVSAIDSNGKTLKAGTDYARPDSYTYVGSPNVADASGGLVVRRDGDPVGAEDIPLPGTTIRVRVKALGAYAPIGAGEAVRYADYRIVAADISNAVVRVKKKTYLSGRPVTLEADDLTVTLNGDELICGRDYMIDETTYRNNIAKGTASVVIRGCGSSGDELYGGSKTVKYTIGSRWFF